MRKRLLQFCLPLLLVAGLLAGCGAPTAALKVGSKDFTESFLLAEMYALLLEDAGFKVERRFNLGGTPVAHAALLAGDIDLYPEYTGNGLLIVLKEKPLADAASIMDAVRKGYRERFQLAWLDPAPFNNTQELATTKAVAQKYGLETYSDLAARAGELRLGGPAEFAGREDGIKGLQQAYGGFRFKEFRQLGTGSLRYEALKAGEVDVAVAFGTDGQIAAMSLVLLRDDRNFYPLDQAAPVVRQDVLERNAALAPALNRLAPLLTTRVMAGLNWQVDGPDKKEFAAVAKAFLREKGLLKK